MHDFTLVRVELHLPRLCPFHRCVEVSLQFLLTVAADFRVIRKLEHSRRERKRQQTQSTAEGKEGDWVGFQVDDIPRTSEKILSQRGNTGSRSQTKSYTTHRRNTRCNSSTEKSRERSSGPSPGSRGCSVKKRDERTVNGPVNALSYNSYTRRLPKNTENCTVYNAQGLCTKYNDFIDFMCSNDIDVCAKTGTWLKARLDPKKIFYPMKIVNTRNYLPASVAEAPTIGSFKRRLKKHRRSLVISQRGPSTSK